MSAIVLVNIFMKRENPNAIITFVVVAVSG